jgi:predicted AlkP superfamily phosphohydrolase/phosphomutase
MPNFGSILGEGVFTRLSPTIPEVSSVSWSSIITGVNPGEHGVFGFTDIIPGTYSISFHSIRKLRAMPFWSNDGYRYVIINVPATFPAQPLNGVIVTGFVSPDISRSVYPDSLLPILKDINYRIDIDLERARKSRRVLVDELFDTLSCRVRLYRYLWDNVDWDVFMLVVTGSDRLGHFLWDAYVGDDGEYRDAFIQFFKAIDFVIGEIRDKLGEDDLFVVLSDHGMELKRGNINVNKVLVDEGYLKIGDPSRRYNGILEGSIAFALDPGRIYLNYIDRYPRGYVKPGERDRVLDELVDLFSGLRYEGRRVVKRVFRREDIYSGRFVEYAPDLVLVPMDGFNFTGRVDVDTLFERDYLTGSHNEDAFLYVNRDFSAREGLFVYDVIRLVGLGGGLVGVS